MSDSKSPPADHDQDFQSQQVVQSQLEPADQPNNSVNNPESSMNDQSKDDPLKQFEQDSPPVKEQERVPQPTQNQIQDSDQVLETQYQPQKLESQNELLIPLQEKEQEILELKKKIDSMHEDLSNMEKTLAKKEHEYQDLNQKVKQLEANCFELAGEKEKLSERVIGLVSEQTKFSKEQSEKHKQEIAALHETHKQQLANLISLDDLKDLERVNSHVFQENIEVLDSVVKESQNPVKKKLYDHLSQVIRRLFDTYRVELTYDPVQFNGYQVMVFSSAAMTFPQHFCTLYETLETFVKDIEQEIKKLVSLFTVQDKEKVTQPWQKYLKEINTYNQNKPCSDRFDQLIEWGSKLKLASTTLVRELVELSMELNKQLRDRIRLIHESNRKTIEMVQQVQI